MGYIDKHGAVSCPCLALSGLVLFCTVLQDVLANIHTELSSQFSAD